MSRISRAMTSQFKTNNKLLTHLPKIRRTFNLFCLVLPVTLLDNNSDNKQMIYLKLAICMFNGVMNI